MKGRAWRGKKTPEEVEKKTCLTQLIICYLYSKDSGINTKSVRKQIRKQKKASYLPKDNRAMQKSYFKHGSENFTVGTVSKTRGVRRSEVTKWLRSDIIINNTLKILSWIAKYEIYEFMFLSCRMGHFKSGLQDRKVDIKSFRINNLKINYLR